MADLDEEMGHMIDALHEVPSPSMAKGVPRAHFSSHSLRVEVETDFDNLYRQSSRAAWLTRVALAHQDLA